MNHLVCVLVFSCFMHGTIYCVPFTDGKYHVTESGVLRVLTVTAADTRAAFRCRTLNVLTAAAQLSGAARILLTGTLLPSLNGLTDATQLSGAARIVLTGTLLPSLNVLTDAAGTALRCSTHRADRYVAKLHLVLIV
jgi:hypothetical protein